MDLRDAGERCGKNRVARLMRENGISAIAGRKRRSGTYSAPQPGSANILDREFTRDELENAWATDITYIRGVAPACGGRSSCPFEPGISVRQRRLDPVLRSAQPEAQRQSARHAYDNAAMESFFASLKKERVVNGKPFSPPFGN